MGIPDEDLRPTWSPPGPVNFDHELATNAIKLCRDLARQIRELRDKRVTKGDLVLQHWAGKYRYQWEPPHRTARDDEFATAEQYDSLAGRIQGWATAATEAENFRIREKARWQEEYDHNRELVTPGTR